MKYYINWDTDFRVDFFRAGGKGGQHQNKTETGVRFTHLPTGVSAESRDTRHRSVNIAMAKTRVKQKLKLFLERQLVPKAKEPMVEVRKYSSPDNRTKDAYTGAVDTFDSVIHGDGLDKMIEQRIREKALGNQS
jgi:protein subunit release factor A